MSLTAVSVLLYKDVSVLLYQAEYVLLYKAVPMLYKAVFVMN